MYTSLHTTSVYDIFIIGGGINGCGIARDAAGRGLKVFLCDQGDLGGATSSSSSKLIHGGLRYLEHFAFRLVKEGLTERDVLLRNAAHIIHPLQFVLLPTRNLRPQWMIRIGLWIYDCLARGTSLPKSVPVRLLHHPAGFILHPWFTKGFLYSDCWVDDARLVIVNALAAVEHGATVVPRTRCIRAQRKEDVWEIVLRPCNGGGDYTVYARTLVNAAGPWVNNILKQVLRQNPKVETRLVKGSHVVVRRKTVDSRFAYSLQNDDDRRIVFSIPFETQWTLIGTTECEFQGDPSDASMTKEEIEYLCHTVNKYFKHPLKAEDCVWTFSGVRPLIDDRKKDPSAVTRDYLLVLDKPVQKPPLLSVYGGKLTTFRRLAEEVTKKLSPFLRQTWYPWTHKVPLPGGDFTGTTFEGFCKEVQSRYAWLPQDLLRRYARAYGTRLENIVGHTKNLKDLGEYWGSGLYEAEADYLYRSEWATSSEDILWRRTKLGLYDDKQTTQKLQHWIKSQK